MDQEAKYWRDKWLEAERRLQALLKLVEKRKKVCKRK